MRLILLGDVMLGRLVNHSLKGRSPDYVWGDVLPFLRMADGVILNLECVISDLGEPWPGKVFTFRSDLKNAECLRRAGVTAVSLANNHALDYGSDALAECLSVLSGHGIGAAGAGESLDAARKPAVFPLRTMSAALIAFTDNAPEWEARGATPGTFYAPVDPDDSRFRLLLQLVQQARTRADLVIVSAHWGSNWGDEPPESHVEAGRLLVEAGADVVFGHSAHVFRGIGFHREKPILYSCGDFVDDYAVDEVERNDQSFAFCLDFERTTLRRVFLIPTVIRNLQARVAKGRSREEILARMQALCTKLGTTGLRETEAGLEILPVTSAWQTAPPPS